MQTEGVDSGLRDQRVERAPHPNHRPPLLIRTFLQSQALQNTCTIHPFLDLHSDPVRWGRQTMGSQSAGYTASVPEPGLEHSGDFFLSITACPAVPQTDRMGPRLPSTYTPRACRSQTARILSSRAAAGWPRGDTRCGQRRSPGHSAANPTAVSAGLGGEREESKPRGMLV